MTPRTTLLTGATGFLGSSLAVELLRAGREQIYCLVRPQGDVTVRLHAAVLAAAEAAGVPDIAPQLHRIVPLAGDISRPDLGLAPDDRERLLAEPPDECWHSAASLRYEDRHKNEILGTNVDGARHVIETVEALGIPEFNHISTAYVAGVRVGRVPEGPYDPAYAPNNWYEASKRQGEDLVEAHAERFDRVRIMRPSIVVGNLSTYRSTSDSGYYGFLRGVERFCRLVQRRDPGYLAEHRVKLLLEPESSLNLVPIDVLVREAVELADDPEQTGRYFHLTNPFPLIIGRMPIGPESAIEGLRLDLVEDREQLGELDLLLDDALDFYRPYLRNDKDFVRARDASDPPEAMRITDDDLVGLSVTHFEQRDEARAKARAKAAAFARATA